MLVKYEKRKRYNHVKLVDNEKERQTQETVEELMNGKVMEEAEDTVGYATMNDATTNSFYQ
jgi:hypothetical protein